MAKKKKLGCFVQKCQGQSPSFVWMTLRAAQRPARSRWAAERRRLAELVAMGWVRWAALAALDTSSGLRWPPPRAGGALRAGFRRNNSLKHRIIIATTTSMDIGPLSSPAATYRRPYCHHAVGNRAGSRVEATAGRMFLRGRRGHHIPEAQPRRDGLCSGYLPTHRVPLPIDTII